LARRFFVDVVAFFFFKIVWEHFVVVVFSSFSFFFDWLIEAGVVAVREPTYTEFALCVKVLSGKARLAT